MRGVRYGLQATIRDVHGAAGKRDQVFGHSHGSFVGKSISFILPIAPLPRKDSGALCRRPGTPPRGLQQAQ